MNPIQWLRALRAMILADMTPPADRAEVAKAGGSLRVDPLDAKRAAHLQALNDGMRNMNEAERAALVRRYVETQMTYRRMEADVRARNLFARGLVTSAAESWIAAQMSDGIYRIVEEVES